MTRQVESYIRVRYAETDAMGVAHHSSYLVWFEVGRSEYFRAIMGSGPNEFFQRHNLPVVEARVRYFRPCLYDELIVVVTRLEEIRSRKVRFAYEARRDGELLAEGWTVHVCTDLDGLACRLPDEIYRTLEKQREE